MDRSALSHLFYTSIPSLVLDSQDLEMVKDADFGSCLRVLGQAWGDGRAQASCNTCTHYD